MKNRRILIIASAVLAVLLIAGIVVLLARESDLDRYRRDAEGKFEDPTRQLEEMVSADTSVTYEQVLSDYKKWAVYPPNSRPLRPEFTDVIEFQKIPLPFQLMPIPDGNGGLKPGKFQCRLQPVEHTVVEGESMEVQLQCQDPEAAGDPRAQQGTEIKVESVELLRYLDTQTWPVADPEIKPGTAQESYITTFVFKPKRDDWGNMDFAVKFKLPAEGSGHTHELKTHFFSSPVAPAQFTGNFRERLDNGSLIISAEMEVRMPGRYEIQANLFAEDQTPIASAKTYQKLTGGRQFVDLLFFGKLLRDYGQGGPYVLMGAHGLQDTDPLDPDKLSGPPDEVEKLIQSTRTTEPNRRVIPRFKGKFVTQPYSVSDFSDKEYDSDEKRERIEELSKLAGG
jgi:hypothetical protein